MELVRERQHHFLALLQSHNASAESSRDIKCFSAEEQIIYFIFESSIEAIEVNLKLYLLDCDKELCSGKTV